MPPKFVPRERKHKRLAKQKPTSAVDENANADVLLPKTAAEKEERRRKLQEELRAQQPQSKITSKKRKRLDHYIDTKLRKEENQELIKKLAAQQVDTSLLQSAKKLGRVGESKREGLQRALKERERGIDVRGDHDAILFERRRSVEEPLDEPEHVDEDEDDDASRNGAEVKAPQVDQPVVAPKVNGVGSGGLFGGGLKRPLEMGEDGRPVIKKRKRRKREDPRARQTAEDEDEEMEGASEGASEGHSDSEESDFRGFDSEPEEDSQDDNDESSEEEDSEEEEEEEEEEESDEDGEDKEGKNAAKKARSSAFKLWATEQRHDALGFKPSTAPLQDEVIKAAFKPRAPSLDPVAQALASIPTDAPARPKSAITIPRSEEIQKVRMELPVVQEEQKIMEAIHNNPVVVVCGATGSGKTTQVPQMMYESGYGALIGNKDTTEDAGNPSLGRGMIGVTQPRRVAAVSVADRVATEMGDEYKNRVGHQVRYDTTVSRETAMKFMTDGILLREISKDFILSKYSAIVIDEAHERSVNTDILIGMLSRIVNLRDELSKEEPEKYYPLKLVIMSATLRVSDFMQNQRLFRNGAPPIVEAEGRQYPVTVHFSRKTQRDFVAETVTKVARGHKKLPPGSILVFLTGQNEIETVAKRLKDALGGNTAGYGKMLKAKESADQMPLELEDMEESSHRKPNDTLEGEDSDDSDAEFEGVDDAEDAEFEVEDDSGPRGALKPHILPLYASLPTVQQMRVFQPPPDGSRMIVLATNVAETSLTIPGVRYVFDCGRSKEKKYDTSTGVQTFEIDWISKASASQRSGRAGRTGPGHCYRLYSSAVFENYFAEHSIPEVLRTPLESTVLQLKAMEIDHVVNFPFPTPPDRSQLATAEKLLSNLGAIDAKTGRITDTGRELIKHPVSPRFGKMLLLAQRNNLVVPSIATVAALAVGDLMIPEAQFNPSGSKDEDADSDYDSDRESRASARQAESAAQTAAQRRHQAYGRAQATLSRWDDRSDSIKMLTAVAAHADALSKQTASAFCADFFLREKAMQEVQQLRAQLHNIVRSTQRSAAQNKAFSWQPTVALPSERERKLLNQIVASGFIDNLAIRNDLLPNAAPSALRKPRRAIEVPYTTLFPSTDSVDRTAPPEQQEMQRSVFVHAASVLARRSVAEMPAYIIYSHLSRAAASSIADAGTAAMMPRTRMHPLTALGAKQVAALAEGTPLLELGKPVGKIEELEGGKKRVCWVSVEVHGPAGVAAAPWPMGAWKVRQSRGKKGDWVVDEVLAR